MRCKILPPQPPTIPGNPLSICVFFILFDELEDEFSNLNIVLMQKCYIDQCASDSRKTAHSRFGESLHFRFFSYRPVYEHNSDTINASIMKLYRNVWQDSAIQFFTKPTTVALGNPRILSISMSVCQRIELLNYKRQYYETSGKYLSGLCNSKFHHFCRDPYGESPKAPPHTHTQKKIAQR